MFFERGMSRAHVQVDGSSVQLRFFFCLSIWFYGCGFARFQSGLTK